MGNWRVVLLVGAVVAVVLVGASMWVKDNPTNHQAYRVNGLFGTRRAVQVPNQPLADTRSRYLRFTALAVIVVTLASIPLLRERERRRYTAVT